MKSVLFVCTGNTCRSPMAEALLRQLWKQAGGGEELEVLSAGTSSVPGLDASQHAVTALRSKGLDLTGHRSRSVDAQLLAGVDLVLTMTERHREHLLALAPGTAGKVFTLGEYAGDRRDVSDPFGGSLAEYEATVKDLEHLLQAAVDRIRKERRTES